MKIIVCGKGGSGKSTIATLTAKALRGRGFDVLLIDADESNLGLHRLMGVAAPVNIMDDMGGKKSFKQKMNSGFSTSPAPPFRDVIGINDISKDCITTVDGVRLISIGKIHEAGEGCACPMGILSKMVLSGITVKNSEIVIIDTAAGVEHFGRGIDLKCDLILNVVDPTFESFMLAKKIEKMADTSGIEIFHVLNKVEDEVIDAMTSAMDQEKVIARIPANKAIFVNSLKGKELFYDMPELDPVCDLIEKKNPLN